MYELWLLLVKGYRKVRDKTWGPLGTKFLNKVIPFDVAFDAAGHKLTKKEGEGLWAKLQTPLIVAVVTAIVTVLLTELLRSCKRP